MAPKFGFKITADDDTKRDVSSAKKGLDSLGSAGDKAGRLLKAAFAGFTLVKVTQEIDKALDAFGEQERAELRLIAAARNNPLLNGDAVRGLRDYAASLQNVTIFGDEALIQQAAFLGNLQRSEEEIKGILDAAVNLASTGMVSLESAVRNISKTYAGMTGELGELIPQLRNLTAEELEAGAAVDLIAENFSGMAEAAAAGVAGAREQIRNMIGDLREQVGNVLAPIMRGILERVRPVIQKMIDWFAEHSNQIINFFVNFPEVAALSFNLVRGMLEEVFTFDFAARAVESFSTYMTNQFKSVFEFLGTLVAAIGITIWEPLKTGFEWVAYGIKKAFQAVANALYVVFETIVIGPINAVIAGLEKVVDAGRNAAAWLVAFFKHPFSRERRQAAFQEAISGRVSADFGRINLQAPQFRDLARPSMDADAIAGAWKRVLESLPAYASRTWQNVANLGKDIGGQFKDNIQAFVKGIEDVLGRELTDKVKGPILHLEEQLDEQTETVKASVGLTGPALIETEFDKPGVRLAGAGEMWARPHYQWAVDRAPLSETEFDKYGMKVGGPGFMARFTQAGGGGSPLVGLEGALAGLGDTVVGAMEKIQSLTALMDPVMLVFQGLINTIAGPLNRALAPLIGIFVSIGNLIGNILTPIIDQTAPILEKLAEAFVWFHNNVLKHIGNALIYIMTVVHNALKTVANGFIAIVRGVVSLLNEIPGVNIRRPSYLQITDPAAAANIQDINYASVYNAGADQVGGLTAGSGASFTGGHDVTINFTINTDVLLGDRRELAAWLAEELRDVFELGIAG